MFDARLIPYGDAAILIHYDEVGFTEGLSRYVQALASTFRANGYWEDVVTGYDSVLVSFCPAKMSMDTAHKRIKKKLEGFSAKDDSPARRVEIPVYYGGDYGPDMGNIMKSSGLSEEEIIAKHSGQDYLVCMMGFIPGFAFLSEAPEALHHPRHASPRLSVPAGSVGIAGWQTGIYGLESPGGWQVIGRTPEKIFDKNRDEPFLLSAGDKVRFVPAAGGGA